jgi:hypothetical protein
VRPGTTPWARYPRYEHEPLARVNARVEVRNEGARRTATVPVEGTVGILRAIAPRTREYASLVLGFRGSGDYDRLHVTAVNRWPKSGEPTTVDELRATERGEIRLDDVEPGHFELWAWSAKEAWSGEIAVAESGETRGEFSQEWRARPGRPTRPGSHVGSRSIGWSGRPERAVLGPRWFRASHVRAWISPALEGDQLLKALLPHDRLEVRLVAEHVPTVRPGLDGTLAPPDAGLVRHGFRVRAAGSDAPLVGEVAFGPGGNLFPREALASDAWFDAPKDARFTWSVWVPGRKPVWGDERAFARAEDGTFVVEVRVEPGTGHEILLRAGDPEELAGQRWPWPDGSMQERAVRAALGGPAVERVKVWLDAFPGPQSDEFGVVRIAHPILPREVELRGRGYRLVALDPLPGAGRRYVAWLKRYP